MDPDQMLQEMRKDSRDNFDRIYQVMAKVETDNASQTANLKSITDEIRFLHEQYEGIDVRMRCVEQNQSRTNGIVVALGAAITIIMNVLFLVWAKLSR